MLEFIKNVLSGKSEEKTVERLKQARDRNNSSNNGAFLSQGRQRYRAEVFAVQNGQHIAVSKQSPVVYQAV